MLPGVAIAKCFPEGAGLLVRFPRQVRRRREAGVVGLGLHILVPQLDVGEAILREIIEPHMIDGVVGVFVDGHLVHDASVWSIGKFGPHDSTESIASSCSWRLPRVAYGGFVVGKRDQAVLALHPNDIL